jgi:hypothetical protein
LAWKKVSSLAAEFGMQRLTHTGRKRMARALNVAGITLDPPLEELNLHDTVHLYREEGQVSEEVDQTLTHSDRLPDQIITWDVSNIGDADGLGEWLRCLKSTQPGDRQFIWEGSSQRGIVGVVTYSGPIRNLGVYEGWGQFDPFPEPISRDNLLACGATTYRFGKTGIRALQGTAIRLSEAEAEAIVGLLGGLNPTELPWDEPDEFAQLIPWTRANGLPAEKFAEDEIRRNRRIWRQLGLPQRPRQQVTLQQVGRADLVSCNTIIEVKKVVSLDNGPAQIERYLGYLAESLGVGPDGVRGILVQKNSWATQALKERLADSEFPLELWSLDRDSDWKWQAQWILGP